MEIIIPLRRGRQISKVLKTLLLWRCSIDCSHLIATGCIAPQYLQILSITDNCRYYLYLVRISAGHKNDANNNVDVLQIFKDKNQETSFDKFKLKKFASHKMNEWLWVDCIGLLVATSHIVKSYCPTASPHQSDDMHIVGVLWQLHMALQVALRLYTARHQFGLFRRTTM